MHVVHIQLEIRRQFINEGSLFVTASVALQGCRSQRAVRSSSGARGSAGEAAGAAAASGEEGRWMGKCWTRMKGCFSSGSLG